MEPTVLRVKETGESIINIGSRISLLEKDSVFMTEMVMQNEKRLEKKKSQALESIQRIRENIEIIKNFLKNSKIELDVLIGKLKESATAHQLDIVKEKVDEWGPERFITKADIEENFEY